MSLTYGRVSDPPHNSLDISDVFGLLRKEDIVRIIYISLIVISFLSLTACNTNSDRLHETIEPPVIEQTLLEPTDNGETNTGSDINKDKDTVVPKELEVDLSPLFDGLLGTAVFLDKSGNYTVYNQAASEMRASPCSTFKIISTLATFEYDIVSPQSSVIKWDGTNWKYESWNKDLTILEAFQSSCVWYYRKLIDKIGQDNMADFVNMLDYGNCDTTQWEGSGFNRDSRIDGFWLESSLLISPKEQVDVIYSIFEGETKIEQNQDIRKDRKRQRWMVCGFF